MLGFSKVPKALQLNKDGERLDFQLVSFIAGLLVEQAVQEKAVHFFSRDMIPVQ